MSFKERERGRDICERARASGGWWGGQRERESACVTDHLDGSSSVCERGRGRFWERARASGCERAHARERVCVCTDHLDGGGGGSGGARIQGVAGADGATACRHDFVALRNAEHVKRDFHRCSITNTCAMPTTSSRPL